MCKNIYLTRNSLEGIFTVGASSLTWLGTRRIDMVCRNRDIYEAELEVLCLDLLVNNQIMVSHLAVLNETFFKPFGLVASLHLASMNIFSINCLAELCDDRNSEQCKSSHAYDTA
jgi:hypothetical protein